MSLHNVQKVWTYDFSALFKESYLFNWQIFLLHETIKAIGNFKMIEYC